MRNAPIRNDAQGMHGSPQTHHTTVRRRGHRDVGATGGVHAPVHRYWVRLQRSAGAHTTGVVHASGAHTTRGCGTRIYTPHSGAGHSCSRSGNTMRSSGGVTLGTPTGGSTHSARCHMISRKRIEPLHRLRYQEQLRQYLIQASLLSTSPMKPWSPTTTPKDCQSIFQSIGHTQHIAHAQHVPRTCWTCK
jgi:hypothetical protein